MSTSYGYAVVAFPGLPPVQFHTVDGWIGLRGYHSWRRFLPPRTICAESGKKVRLSRKERSRLRTSAEKWSKGYRGRGRGGKRRSFRTTYDR